MKQVNFLFFILISSCTASVECGPRKSCLKKTPHYTPTQQENHLANVIQPPKQTALQIQLKSLIEESRNRQIERDLIMREHQQDHVRTKRELSEKIIKLRSISLDQFKKEQETYKIFSFDEELAASQHSESPDLTSNESSASLDSLPLRGADVFLAQIDEEYSFYDSATTLAKKANRQATLFC